MRRVQFLAWSLSLSLAIAFAAAQSGGSAQSPESQPRVQPADLHYLGSFSVPSTDGTNQTDPLDLLTYGGHALGIGTNGDTLLIGCHDWNQRLAEITIPPIGGTAQIVQPCRETNLGAGFVGGTSKLGGSLVWQGRAIISGYLYYDASGSATRSHAVLGQPWTRVGSAPVAFVGGYMGIVPPEWRALLGGPAVTGQCCLSIISRTSSGPALSVFDPADIGIQSPVPATQVLGYPLAHALDGLEDQSNLFNLSTTIGGVAFPSGTRSVLFIGKIGTGPYCYGEAAACGDPTNDSKGEHMYPYIHQVWAYDATDLLKVKRGELQPWDVKPYTTWRLTEMNSNGSATMRPGGAVFDPATRRIYVTNSYGEQPQVYVYEIMAGTDAPPDEEPPPVDEPPVEEPPMEEPPVEEPPASDAVLDQLVAIRSALEALTSGAACTVTGESAYANGDARLTVRCPAGAVAKGDAVRVIKR